MTGSLSKRAELLARLREICLSLPESKETLTWGNPTFVAGKKQFAVLDRYHDKWCIAFAVSGERQRELLKRPGFFPAPYGARYGWVCRDAEGRIGWKDMQELLLESYKKVALKRMLEALGKMD